MTIEQNSVLPKRFVTAMLPWLVGLGALIVYLATMNTWATASSVSVVARASGWTWQPDLQHPLLFLVLAPFRLLPEHLVPLALNGFNALLAALVITLLARSVALLPQDRTAEQRALEDDDFAILSLRAAWIPPVFAALVLGLQISFWENATAITGEMIDTFIVAYVIRCLLEFRIDQRQSWLSRAAFLYAAGMTNNWALIGLLPVFFTAIIWFKGLSFFNLGFLGRMTLCSIAGLLLYALLPALQSMDSLTPVDFWPALKTNFTSQKAMLGGVYGFLKDNYRIVLVAATSVLPLFFIALRWRSSFGDHSHTGILVAKAVFHIVHAMFLVTCLVVTLSPQFSPRQMVWGNPFLTHYYFGALTIGYCTGYFLLVCSPAFRRRSRMNPLIRLVSRVGAGAVVALVIVMPVALLSRNLDVVKAGNGRLVQDYVRSFERHLPPAPCVILSDDAAQLALLRAHLVTENRARGYTFLDTLSAKWTDYHVFQHQHQPDWPTNFISLTNHAEIKPIGLISLLGILSTNQSLCYLQPSFGYFFERFQMQPAGIDYLLTPYPTNSLLNTPLSELLVATNSRFWSEFDDEVMPALNRFLPSEDKPRKRAWNPKLMARLHLPDERSMTAEALAISYSRAANYWAVELQRLGRWDEAATSLDRALALNPDNIAAQINQAYNKAHRDGGAPPEITGAIEDRFGRYKNWNQLMGDCGPFDEPRFTFEQARTYLAGGLYRQALIQLERVTELQPTNFIANIWKADIHTVLGLPAGALKIVQHISSNPASFGVNATNKLDLARVQATALFRSGDKQQARTTLETALSDGVAGNQFRALATQLYLQNGLNAEALPLLDRMIADNPANVSILANRGFACMQLERYDEARKSLTSALELDPNNKVVRLNRAITLLRAKDYDASSEDYEALLVDNPDAYQVHFGLGEIAVARSNTPVAIEHFEACIKHVPPGSPDFIQISNRLATVRAGKP